MVHGLGMIDDLQRLKKWQIRPMSSKGCTGIAFLKWPWKWALMKQRNIWHHLGVSDKVSGPFKCCKLSYSKIATCGMLVAPCFSQTHHRKVEQFNTAEVEKGWNKDCYIPRPSDMEKDGNKRTFSQMWTSSEHLLKISYYNTFTMLDLKGKCWMT